MATATPTSGVAPLTVQLSAAASTDPDDAASTLTYAWDANGDGVFNDGNQATLSYTYPTAGTYTATVRVTDPHGASSTASVPIVVSKPAESSGDLALKGTATASSIEEAGFEAGKANDGNASTRWSSLYTDSQWWQVDLGSAQQVDEVKINWEAAYGARYQIQTSTDGKTFTTAAEVTDTGAGVKTTTFAARSARYVKVQGVKRGTQWGYSFWSAEVFGPGAAEQPANQPPKAVATATPTSGTAPLKVLLNASGSTDPDDAASTLTYAWDANGDGVFNDGTQSSLEYTYPTAGTYTATVRVTDPHGASSTASVQVQVSAPEATRSGDLALKGTATASSIEEAGFEAGKANDGNAATRWSSLYTNSQWWQVDLGSAQQVDEVKINWEAAYGARYLIQTSTDGKTFTTAAEVTNKGSGVKTTTFTARSARYVKIQGVTRGTEWGYSFWSAEVFGPGSS